jgi:hypothetical protein
MAETVEDEIENALNLVVRTVDQSSNMRKTLKEKIFETVSTLRHLFAKIKISSECKRSEIEDLTRLARWNTKYKAAGRSKTRHRRRHLLTTQLN